MIRLSGFVGIESYDLIWYLTKVARTMGKQVLLVDNSTDYSLAFSIPGLMEAPIGTLFDYNGVSAVVCDNSFQSVWEDQFDYIFVYFGKNTSRFADECDEIFLVTDYQKHNIEFIKNVQLQEDQFAFLVIRDRISSKITPGYVQYEMSNRRFQSSEVILIEDTLEDLENKVLLQHNAVKKLKRFSQSIQEFIITVLGADDEVHTIKTAIKMLRR